MEEFEVPFVSITMSPSYLGSDMKVFATLCEGGPFDNYWLAFQGNGPPGGFVRLPIVPTKSSFDGITRYSGVAYFGPWQEGYDNGSVTARRLHASREHSIGSFQGGDPVIKLTHPVLGGCPAPGACMNPINGTDQYCECNCYGPNESYPCQVAAGRSCCPDDDLWCGTCEPINQMEGCNEPAQEQIPYVGAKVVVAFDSDNYTSPTANCVEYAGRRCRVTATYYYGGLPGDGYDGTTTQVSQVAYTYGCKSSDEWWDHENNDCHNTCPFGQFDYSYITYKGGHYAVRPTCCLEFDPYIEEEPDRSYCGDWYASCDCLTTPLWGVLVRCPSFASGYDWCGSSGPVRYLSACQATGPIPDVRVNPPPWNNAWPDDRFWINGGIYPG